MLDYKTLIKDVKKTIRSHSADELQEWIDSYYQRIALAEQEDDLAQSAIVSQMTIGKLNGSPSAVAKSKGTLAQKPARTTKVMATVDSL